MKKTYKNVILNTIVFILLIFISSCSTSETLHEQISGTWKNDVMTVKIDFENSKYSGVALGKEFSKKLSLIKEEANIVIFLADNAKITCQIQSKDKILLTKEGGIPLSFERL